MSNIGLFCPPLPGHLHPSAVLGRALIAQGHRVTVFQIAQFRTQVEAENLDFHPLGETEISLSNRVREIGRSNDLRSLKAAVEGARQSAENICLCGPRALEERSIELVLADQNEPAAGTVAERLGIPFVSLCPSLPLNRESAIPPPFVGWSYSRSRIALLRNALGLRASDLLIAPINRTINRYRTSWQLQPLRTPDDSFSKLAQLSQMTQDFDFPRRCLPETFHSVGPWLDPAPFRQVDFPFDRLDGRLLVYASFGTLQPNAGKQFIRIAEACRSINLQLVIAMGSSSMNLQKLPADPVVVPYAPQLELISRAAIVITHGGMNTVMQSLRFGKPMIVIPQTHDQPAIAARVARAQAGIVLRTEQVSSTSIQHALHRLLSDSQFANTAQKLQNSILQAGGTAKAVEVIEKSLQGFRK